MTINHDLATGTSVQIKGNPSGIELRSSTGTIVRRDHMGGYYIVRLDEPALVYDVPGTGEEINEIVEVIDNLEVIEPSR
jgi:hypothetical protein